MTYATPLISMALNNVLECTETERREPEGKSGSGSEGERKKEVTEGDWGKKRGAEF